MLEQFTPTTISAFKGWFANGPAEKIPSTHFRTARNIRYFNGGFETRWGTTPSILTDVPIRRFFPYKIEGQQDRTLYLDGSGRIFDSLYPGQVILNIPNMVDFSMEVFNDRAYLSPHDRRRGLPSQVVYLYQGGGLQARPAAGSRPRGFTLSSVSAGAGHIEAGTRLFAVAYETDSGFITGPGPEILSVFVSSGSDSARVSNISVGPVGTVARHLLATQRILTYDGDQIGPELFFVPNGKLEDNETTEIVVDFYDSQLEKSADYLRDEMETIPAVLGMASYQGSLVGWGAQVDDSTVYVSKSGEPESISLIDGGIEVDRSEAGGVRNCLEYRGQLMIHKSRRTYAVTSDANEPSFWKPISIDQSVGTEVFGIAKILGEDGTTVDRYVIAARQGLLVFSGVFNIDLTWKIKDVWKRITKNSFNTIQAAIDTDAEVIYVAVPLDGATSPNAILCGDYSEGMDPENIRWSEWTFPYSPSTIGVDLSPNGTPILKIGSGNNNIYALDSLVTSDDNVAIPDPTFETFLNGADEVAVTNFGGVRLRCTGVGDLNLTINTLDDVTIQQPPSLTMAVTPGKFLQREFVSLSAQYASVKFNTADINDKFRITKIILYSDAEYLEEPGG